MCTVIFFFFGGGELVYRRMKKKGFFIYDCYLKLEEDLVPCLGDEAPEEGVPAVQPLKAVVLVVLYWRL